MIARNGEEEEEQVAIPAPPFFLLFAEVFQIFFESFNLIVKYRFSITYTYKPVIVAKVVVEIFNQLIYPRF